MDIKVTIDTKKPVDPSVAVQLLDSVTGFLDLDEQGYVPVYGNAVVVDTETMTIEKAVDHLHSSHEKGLAKMQEFLEKDEHGGYKLDNGEHVLEDNTSIFWFIVSKGK